MKKNCAICNKEFSKPYGASRTQWSRRRYCSSPCRIKGSYGHQPWNKGIKLPQFSGEKSGVWKGESAGYFARHTWVYRRLGKPSLCAHCGTTVAKKFEWANISKEYLRDIGDWVRLCVSCHHKFDEITTKRSRGVNGRFI